jgi:PAS domain S-box-containing protein
VTGARGRAPNAGGPVTPNSASKRKPNVRSISLAPDSGSGEQSILVPTRAAGSAPTQEEASIAIPDRDLVEAELDRERKFSERLINSTVEGIFAFDRRCRYTVWNPAMEAIFGIAKDRVIGRVAFDVFPFLKETGEDKFFFEALSGRTIRAMNRPYRVSESGQEGCFEGHYGPVRDLSDAVIGGIAIVHDVTEQKRAEAALKESEARLRAVVESMDDIVFEIDESGTYLNIWTGNEALLPRPKKEMIGQHIDGFFGGEPDKPTSETLKRVLATGRPESVEYKLSLGNGLRWFSGRVSPIRSEGSSYKSLCLQVRDVTDRKRAEDALRDSEERIRQLVEGVRDYAIFMLDPEGRVLSWNRGAERIKGYRPEEILGKHFSIFHPAEDARSGKPQRDLKVAAEEGRFEGQGWRIRKDGSRFWADVVITALRDENGNLRGFSKVTRDITERKKAEEQLRESEFRFRSITDSASQAIVTSDSHENICSWNRGAQAMFGYTEQEAMGKPVRLFIPEDYRAAQPSGMEPTLSHGSPLVIGNTIEVHGLRKDGTRFPAELSLSTWQADEDTFYTAIISDISLRKEAEDSLRQLSALLLRLQDEERRRLARELHDSTAQTLSALSLNLSALEQLAEVKLPPRARKALTESLALADEACNEVRTFSYLLHPPLLDEAGLGEALRWYVNGFAQRTRIQVDLAVLPAEFGRLSPDIEIALFRVAQEALTNVYRHSGSSTAGVRLMLDSGEVTLEVWDQGKGLPEGSSKHSEPSPATLGVGIRGIRERVRQLGGRMRLGSKQPGAVVEVVLPISRASQARGPKNQ